MGCKWCSSGLGRDCGGPHDVDDLATSCDCDCHVCLECGSAYCRLAGGTDPCEVDVEEDDDDCPENSTEDDAPDLGQ